MNGIIMKITNEFDKIEKILTCAK